MEKVNHPKHYNSHPNGIECIDIIRHYTCDIANAIKYLWRAGLKPEMGMEDAEKEIEDLKKALWYIEDYRKQIPQLPKSYIIPPLQIGKAVARATRHTIDEISKDYESNVGTAINFLLSIGIICNGRVYVSDDWEHAIRDAKEAIEARILDIEHQLLDRELKSAAKMIDSFMTGQPLEAVDGEDYVSKPGCVRETEPEHYDPLNMIIAFGRAYCLSNEVRKRPNNSLHTPCENCDLSEYCITGNVTEPVKYLCQLHQAEHNEYYREVGVTKYSPRFGTIEVVDENKEIELELKRLEEED